MFRRKKASWLIGLLIIVFGMVMVFIFGKVTKVTCQRAEPAQVNCVKRESWLGLIPLSETNIVNVQSAYVDEHIDSEDGDLTYRVVITSDEGDVPLTSFYSGNYGNKGDTAMTINNFVANGREDSLTMTDNSGIAAAVFSGAFVLGGIYMMIVRLFKLRP